IEAVAARETHPRPLREGRIDERELIEYGNRFSEHFYHKRHEVRLPDDRVFTTTPPATLAIARDVVSYALELRDAGAADPERIKTELKAFLAARPSAPVVYPFLRKVLGQKDGPNITTLLAILPREYLCTVHLILSGFSGG